MVYSCMIGSNKISKHVKGVSEMVRMYGKHMQLYKQMTGYTFTPNEIVLKKDKIFYLQVLIDLWNNLSH
jgi:hypothetical protein